MTKTVIGSIVVGAFVVGVPCTGWTWYDTVVNHKDMFGFFPTYLIAALSAGFGGMVGGLAALVVEGMRRSRPSRRG